ncbi:hypothetical protein V6N13_039281 [Hibiscus sabdariffa]|uniref:Uncharacterized protein n=1 Tax=Hibiscus sabdariffa TaxID=183260 RepID=A0ABR2SVZ6_9ROSI
MVKNDSVQGRRKIEMKKIAKRNNLQAHCNIVEAHRDANIRELNAHLAQLVDILEVEKRKGQTLDDVREAGRRQWWWQAPISELGLSELQQLRNALQELKRNVGKQADLLQAAVESRYCWPFLAPNGAETSGLGRERSEVNASSSTTQMHKFDHNLYFEF